MDRYAKVKSKSKMHIVSLITQFRTIFGPRLDKLRMLVELKITNNLPKSLPTLF